MLRLNKREEKHFRRKHEISVVIQRYFAFHFGLLENKNQKKLF